MAEPTKAQLKRADARQRRRGQSANRAPEERKDGGAERDEEQPLEAVKHAAKVAVAGAAVGAAAAAARALTSHDEDQAQPPNDTETKPQTEPENESKVDTETKTGVETALEPGDEAQRPEAQKRGRGHRDHEDDGPASDGDQRRREEPRGAAPDDAKATVRHARDYLEALLDRTVESVSSFERTRDGWIVTLEVVEVSRIPESTDVLASYEMELDDDRNLRRYAQVRRYHRSQADRGEQA